MNPILYLVIGPILWCAYTAWAARHYTSFWTPSLAPSMGEFVIGLFISALLWPLGLAVGLIIWLGGMLYDLLTL